MTPHSVASATPDASARTMTPTQSRVFDRLLAVGTERPTMPPDLAIELEDYLVTNTAGPLRNWTESRLWLSKSRIETALRCEGQLVAEADSPPATTLHAPTVVGIAAHKAIQIAHTHPGHPIGAYVDSAIRASQAEDAFHQFWNDADMATQSDLTGQMVSKAAAFLDSFPPLDQNWTPRFEESIQAKLGKLVLGARPDFVLGRPRPDLRQTMFLADLKTGSINDNHHNEAMFYALAATIRFGVAPFRSVVYSLASGEWTDPDVTPELLWAAAQRVVVAVETLTDVLTDRRPALLSPDRWCTYCPARDTCPANQAQ